ncbi:MAG TPA: arabinofuranosidase catalytic domain-containing protein, partial [Polyangia bacterium]|nr:arabinofuranosidase catalytic domain-containing protein [Polyangia bacterium]
GGGTGGAAGRAGTGGAGGGGAPAGGLPGDVAKAAGTPFVAAHAMTRALFAGYTGPLFKALRTSDKQEKDIGTVAGTGLVDLSALSTFCAGTSCKVTTLYDQSGNGNDMWRADDPGTNQPGTVKPCDLMDIQYWQMSDGTKVPLAVETGAMWKSTAQCLRNRDKTKSMPTGAKPQTEYAIFHAQYLNNNCCFNYGNTGNAVHYSGPGTLSALNFSKITFWSQGTGNGPWPMVDFETGVYAGNTAKCGSGVPSSVMCTSSGQNPNPSVTFDIVTTLFKHNGVNHWALKTGNAKSGNLSVNVDLSALPTGYSPLKQEGGLGLGEGGAGDSNGTGGFSEGAVIAGETSDATDDAIQKSIVAVYGK